MRTKVERASSLSGFIVAVEFEPCPSRVVLCGVSGRRGNGGVCLNRAVLRALASGHRQPTPHPPHCLMASKPLCPKYQYLTSSKGPQSLPFDQPACKDEESPADYNAGGYLPVQVSDTFKQGRYRVVRKLGWVFFFCSAVPLA
jgi:hypothetical protein